MEGGGLRWRVTGGWADGGCGSTDRGWGGGLGMFVGAGVLPARGRFAPLKPAWGDCSAPPLQQSSVAGLCLGFGLWDGGKI